MRSSNPVIVWFRHDLRLADQPALHAAIAPGGPVVPLFIWSPDEEGSWPPGGASRWWLHQSLAALDADLRRLGSQLILRTGDSLKILREVIKSTGAAAVYWNHRFEPACVARDARVAAELRAGGIKVEEFNGSLLFDPEVIQTKQEKPFQVFTPFWRACLSQPEPALPLAQPKKLPAAKSWPKSTPLAALKLEAKIDWAAGIRAAWTPGERGAAKQLRYFLKDAVQHYDTGRDLPGERQTSRLSPHLHYGEISPRQIWHAVHEQQRDIGRRGLSSAAETYLKELGWREFAHHLLVHFPKTTDEPLREQFANFPWRYDKAALTAWQRGQTGYPLVDAGMRELWTTGWMHNRVRMVVASFLVKHLLLDWRSGAKWFWDTLVDADLANNTLGWQWSAGCGADAAPYFRIFNPVTQSQKFDPAGEYIRRWVLELARLSERWIHRPWEAPADELHRARVKLDDTYPRPIFIPGSISMTAARRVKLDDTYPRPIFIPGSISMAAASRMKLDHTYPRPVIEHAAARARALAAFAKVRTKDSKRRP